MDNNNTTKEPDTTENDFHAVEFMREVRAELSEEFLKDKQKYLERLHLVAEEFRKKQNEIWGN